MFFSVSSFFSKRLLHVCGAYKHKLHLLRLVVVLLCNTRYNELSTTKIHKLCNNEQWIVARLNAGHSQQIEVMYTRSSSHGIYRREVASFLSRWNAVVTSSFVGITGGDESYLRVQKPSRPAVFRLGRGEAGGKNDTRRPGPARPVHSVLHSQSLDVRSFGSPVAMVINTGTCRRWRPLWNGAAGRSRWLMVARWLVIKSALSRVPPEFRTGRRPAHWRPLYYRRLRRRRRIRRIMPEIRNLSTAHAHTHDARRWSVANPGPLRATTSAASSWRLDLLFSPSLSSRPQKSYVRCRLVACALPVNQWCSPRDQVFGDVLSLVFVLTKKSWKFQDFFLAITVKYFDSSTVMD